MEAPHAGLKSPLSSDPNTPSSSQQPQQPHSSPASLPSLPPSRGGGVTGLTPLPSSLLAGHSAANNSSSLTPLGGSGGIINSNSLTPLQNAATVTAPLNSYSSESTDIDTSSSDRRTPLSPQHQQQLNTLPPTSLNAASPASSGIGSLTPDQNSNSVRDLENAMSKHLPSAGGDKQNGGSLKKQQSHSPSMTSPAGSAPLHLPLPGM